MTRSFLRHCVDTLTIRSRRDERGAIAVIAALALPMILAGTALSFDIGRVVDENRSMQAVADAVALDAAHFFDGTPASAPDPTISIEGAPFSASQVYYLDQVIQYEATQSALRNGIDITTATASNDVLTIGSCSGTADTLCATFTAIETCPLSTSMPLPGAPGGCQPVAGANPATIVNAVRMSSYGLTNFVFQVGHATQSRSATAMLTVPGSCFASCGTTTTTTPTTTIPTTTTTTVPCLLTCGTTTTSTSTSTTSTIPTTTTTLPPTTTPQGGVSAFTIGSGLVEENTANSNFNTGVAQLDQILTQELHANPVDVTALSFNGLSTASVSLQNILAANSSAGTLQNLLDATITPGQALSDFYNALMQQASSVSVSAASQMSTYLGVGPTGATGITAAGGLQLCQLITITLPGPTTTSACNASGTQLAPVAYAQFNALDWLVGVSSLMNGQHTLSLNLASNVPLAAGLGNLVANVTVNVVSPIATAGPGPADYPSGGKPNCPQNLVGSPPCPVTATDTQAQVSISIPNLPGGVTLNLQAVGAQATGTLDGLTCDADATKQSALIDGSTNAATVTPTFSLAGTSFPGTQESVGSSTFSDTFTGPFGGSTPAPQTTGNANPNIVLGLPSNLSAIPAVGLALSSLNSDLSTIDSQLAPLLSNLGVNIGYATVADNYVNCAVAVLV